MIGIKTRRLLLAAACTMAVWPAIAEEPFGLARGRVLVPVLLDGVGPYPFLLDTCAKGHAVSRGVAQALNLEPAAGDDPDVRRADLGIAGADAGTHSLLEADLAPLEATLGRPVAGLLATACLDGVLTLRFDTGVCAFVPEKPGAIPEDTSPLSASEEGPLVEGELAGLHTGLFLLDTASAYAVSMGQPMATGLGLPGPESPAAEVLPAPGGDPLQRMFLLESASVGGAVMPAPLAAVLSGERRASFGAGLFRQCVLTLGLPNRYLSVSAVSPESVAHAGTGCLPTRREEGHWTLSIIKGSPADQAGLKPGDLLLAVQDTPAADMDYETVRRALEPRAGEPVTLRVGRGGETLTVSLTARPLFGH